MNEFQQILQTLKQPEYVHVLLNPLPVYGLAMGVVALLLALIFREKRAHTIGLVIVALACLSVWPVSEYGELGYDRVRAMSSGDAEQWLHEHEERAATGAWAFYVTAAVAVAGIVCHWLAPKAGAPLTILTLVAALACLGVGGWIGHAGGQIRHSEFRHGAPPAAHDAHDDH